MRKYFLLLIIVSLINSLSYTQECWNVVLKKKHRKLDTAGRDLITYSPKGFSLYRNCYYRVTTKSKFPISGRLIDIKPDTLFFTNFINKNQAEILKSELDTIAFHYRDLDKLYLTADKAFGLSDIHHFKNFDFIFYTTTEDCSLDSDSAQIYQNDTSYYELIPYLNSQGMYLIYEENGYIYDFYGTGMIKPDLNERDTSYNKKIVFWYTPNNVEKVNGLTLGLYTKNIKNKRYNERDTLTINGLNLEINPFAIPALFIPKFNGPYSNDIDVYDSILQKDWRVKINGLNISALVNINESIIKGVNIVGVNSVIDEIHGLSITGINNFSYKMNGLSISGFRNKATQAKGVQIGVINKANDLRGFQIGLWNVNGKRSLPFINWQFKK